MFPATRPVALIVIFDATTIAAAATTRARFSSALRARAEIGGISFTVALPRGGGRALFARRDRDKGARRGVRFGRRAHLFPRRVTHFPQR